MKTTKNTLSPVAAKLLNEATTRLLMLEAKYGFKFGIIADEYDIRMGELAAIAATAPKKRNMLSGLPYGGISSHVKPYLEKMQEDDTVAIPLIGNRPQSVYSTVHTIAERMWGKKSFVLALSDTHIEVWRTPLAAGLKADVPQITHNDQAADKK